MNWKPTSAQLQLIVEHAGGGIPAAKTAKALGVDLVTLQEFARRLEMGRRLDVKPVPPAGGDRPSIWSGFPTIVK